MPMAMLPPSHHAHAMHVDKREREISKTKRDAQTTGGRYTYTDHTFARERPAGHTPRLRYWLRWFKLLHELRCALPVCSRAKPERKTPIWNWIPKSRNSLIDPPLTRLTPRDPPRNDHPLSLLGIPIYPDETEPPQGGALCRVLLHLRDTSHPTLSFEWPTSFLSVLGFSH
jgi:hypothetical protein